MIAKAGLEGLTFHDLRGSTVTRLALEGAPPQEIASVTGHSIAFRTSVASWTGITWENGQHLPGWRSNGLHRPPFYTFPVSHCDLIPGFWSLTPKSLISLI